MNIAYKQKPLLEITLFKYSCIKKTYNAKRTFKNEPEDILTGVRPVLGKSRNSFPNVALIADSSGLESVLSAFETRLRETLKTLRIQSKCYNVKQK